MITKLLKSVALAVGLVSAPFAANAALIGATVDVDFYFPDLSTLYCNSGSAVVGAGVEYAAGCSGFAPVSIDVTDTQIIVGHSNSSFSPGAFNGFLMSILSGPTIAGVTFNAAASTLGVTGIDLTGGGSIIGLNFASQGTGTAVFDVSFGSISAVPVPATIALLVPGLGMMAMVGRRRRKPEAT